MFTTIRPQKKWLRIGRSLVLVTTDRRGRARVLIAGSERIEQVEGLPADANAAMVEQYFSNAAAPPDTEDTAKVSASS